jgi:hypothetical protein
MWPFVHDFGSTSIQRFKKFKNENINYFKIFVFYDIFLAFVIVLDEGSIVYWRGKWIAFVEV